tara:strand:+ start:145 stop:324 length:180 start_codon:yes stop_codon:yes gene_type:complete
MSKKINCNDKEAKFSKDLKWTILINHGKVEARHPVFGRTVYTQIVDSIFDVKKYLPKNI